MAEDVQSISTSRLAAGEVARHSFGTVRRGFDPQEVRSYLELVARELGAFEQHEQDLRRQLAEAEEQLRHPVIDESTLSAALGRQTAQVLRSAHEEAARTTRQAEEEAARIAHQAEETAAALVREAQDRAAELRVQAESGVAERIAEAELSVGSVHQQAQEEAARVLETARVEGESLVALAREQGQALVDQAQETRRRVLADMAQRRRAISLQIEQFRAARDELATTVLGVRDSVDRIVGDLARADDAARAAADDVARRQPPAPPVEVLVEEAEPARAGAELAAGTVRPAGTHHEGRGEPVRSGEVEAPPSAGVGLPGETGVPPAGVAGDRERHGEIAAAGEEAAGAGAGTAGGEPAGGAAGPSDASADAGPMDGGLAGGEVADGEVTAAGAGDERVGAGGEPAGGAVASGEVVERETAGGTAGHEPASAEGDATGGAAGDEVASAEADAVEDLFARIRASQPAGSAAGSDPADPSAGTDDGVGVGTTGVAHPGTGAGRAGRGLPGGQEHDDHDRGEAPAEPAEEGGEGGGSPDDPVRAAGAELLDPVVTRLTRRVKRVLQDDQNALLDRLRSAPGSATAGLLVPEEAQRGHYEAAAAPSLREAVAAGLAFGRSQRGARGRAPAPDEKVVTEAAEGLARTVVGQLRRRLGEEGAGAAGGTDTADRIGAAYREWRGERIERLVGDCALAAFSDGVLAASGRGAEVRWVLAGTGPGCADCDDNALAGAVPTGEEFPTGHRRPPAHAGCRCLVVPTPA